MITSYLGSLAYKSWKLTKIMPNSLKLLNHYILSNAPQKIRQWALKIMVNSSVFIIGTVYRPPSSDSLFFERFQDLLEKLWIKRRNVVIFGDLNCDSARSTDRSITSIFGQKLQNLLLQFDYMVINDKPTRVTKDTSTLIDLVISSNRNLIKNTRTDELGISDHMLVHNARSYINFDQAKFSKDIAEAPWSVCEVFDDLDDC